MPVSLCPLSLCSTSVPLCLRRCALVSPIPLCPTPLHSTLCSLPAFVPQCLPRCPLLLVEPRHRVPLCASAAAHGLTQLLSYALFGFGSPFIDRSNVVFINVSFRRKDLLGQNLEKCVRAAAGAPTPSFWCLPWYFGWAIPTFDPFRATTGALSLC